MLNHLHRQLYLIRKTEEEIARIYPTDKIKSPIHLSIGQEAVSVGVCAALRKQDVVFGSYRSHALYLAKGGDLKKMMAELYGKKTGCASGKGGSMHLIDREAGVMGTSAIVATQIPEAVGFAYAAQLQQKDILTVVFFGDGAVDEGAFSESLNFAALKNLPILFICENNEYAVYSSQKSRQANVHICQKAEAFGVKAKKEDGRDVEKVFAVAQDAVKAIHASPSPRFLEFSVDRVMDHVGPGLSPSTQSLRQNHLPSFREIDQEIAEAFAFAEASPFPEPEELYQS